MDTKHIHCMLEKIAEYGKCMMEEAVGAGNVNLDDAGKIVDMVKDLACAEKDALIAKEMRKAHEEDEAEEKYFLKMLKEEKEDEYKKMKEEYGEEDGERRFYDNYRYANGRFAPTGRGTYRPRSSGRRGGRRGYEEMPYMMTPEMYEMHPAEYYRDMDREAGRLYYSTGGNSGGSSGGGSSYSGSGGGGSRGYSGGSSSNSGGQSGGMSGGNSGGNSRGYSEGFEDGTRRGYQDGYEEGRRSNQGQESRYDRAKRGYEETKQAHKGNNPEDKQLTLKETEKMLNVIFDEIDEMMEDASPEVKSMVKTKGLGRFQKIA